MQSVRSVFMRCRPPPRTTGRSSPAGWPGCPRRLAGYQATLTEGHRRGLHAAPRQVSTVVGQLAEWAATGDGRGWFADFTAGADVPPALRAELDTAAETAMTAFTGLGAWLGGTYLPQARAHRTVPARSDTAAGPGSGPAPNLDPQEAYAWGWWQFLSSCARR